MITENKYIRPSQLAEVIDSAKEYKNSMRFIAGGTDLMANKFQNNEKSKVLIDITGLTELKKIITDTDYIRIGALVTLHELTQHPLIQKMVPSLCKAAASVGTPLIRFSATIGGNVLCENRCLYYNQSDWWREAVGHCLKCDGNICIATGGNNACFSECVSDTAPVLISLQTKIRYISEDGNEKIILLKDIYTGDGVSPRSIDNNELVLELLIPTANEIKCDFQKLRLRESLEFTSLSSAVSIEITGKIRITLTGMDPKPVYLETDKNEELDALAKRLLKMARPVDNDIFTRKYRREMVKVFLQRSYKNLEI